MSKSPWRNFYEYLRSAFPSDTRVLTTVTLRCGDGLRDVSGTHPLADDWWEFVLAVHDLQPAIFLTTDDQGELLGEEDIRDTSIVVNISNRLVLPASKNGADDEGEPALQTESDKTNE